MTWSLQLFSHDVAVLCRRIVDNYIEQLDLSGLSVIHVTGTKGKGSTCAMVESVLRHHGFKTGKVKSFPGTTFPCRRRFRVAWGSPTIELHTSHRLTSTSAANVAFLLSPFRDWSILPALALTYRSSSALTFGTRRLSSFSITQPLLAVAHVWNRLVYLATLAGGHGAGEVRGQTTHQGGVCKLLFSGVGSPTGYSHYHDGNAHLLPPVDSGGVVVLREGGSGRVRVGSGHGREV